MLVHDLIKIKLAREGYLPNYPYHLISTEEMFGSIGIDEPKSGFYQFFDDYYPKPDDSELSQVWEELHKTIVFYLQRYLYDRDLKIPDWVYSYMLGAVIGPQSEVLDIHDLILPLNVDNIDDEFDIEQEQACYLVSKRWIAQTQQKVEYEITKEDIETYKLPVSLFKDGDKIQLRPPTIFGEPHVIKSVRLSQLSI